MSDSGSAASDSTSSFSSENEASNARPSATPSKKQQKQRVAHQSRDMIVQTAFDAYFTQMASRAQTSTNVYSSLIPPLSAEEYTTASASFGPQKIKSELLTSEASRTSLLQRILLELQEGFNIICYGYGSKRTLLNDFAVQSCSNLGNVVVVNAFQPHFGLKDLLSCIEKIPGIDSLPLASSSVENQTRRIYDFYAKSTTKLHLYLIIHNIDSPALRFPKAQSCLSMLALNPKIHIVASVDHINAPILWSSSEISARKDAVEEEADVFARRGFSWLWHDMTTLTPYDFELSHADRSSISGVWGSARKRDATQNGASMITETAALHVLASVTAKAKKLFTLMAEKQLEAIAAATNPGPADDLQQYAIGYDALYQSARTDFIATNDTALRALLGEFRDHDLVVGAQQGSSGEVLWIPMRKERLAKLLKTLKTSE